MNYDREELLDALAAEYAIGTLQGQARHRFVRLLAESPAARSALWRWERRFGEWVATLPAVEPGAQVWGQLSARLFAGPVAVPKMYSWWPRFAVAGMLACVISVAGWWQAAQREGPTHVAQILSEQTQPLWVISADLEQGTMRAKALNVVARDLDQTFELWMLPDAGPPSSLGLLPVGRDQSRVVLPAALAALLVSGAGLAVSVEPPGGSPTGQPTGPIVHQAAFTPL